MPSIALPVSLRGQLLSGVRVFNPVSLFAANEPGVWLDPSDVANLNWRRNLLTWTEQFDNAAWTKTNTTVTANAAAAPDGTTTADATFETVTNGFHQNQQLLTIVSGAVYSMSAYVKANGRSRGAVTFIRNTGSFDGFSINFNLSTETVSVSLNGTGTCTNSGIISVGNGWYRVFGTGTIGVFTDAVALVGVQNDVGAGSYAGDITKGLFIWGAQLELGSIATEYQRITDVNTEVIERFPTATLFQDTAGTTPVTTPGQTVALALDKSKGLVLGPELVTNGDFSNGTTGWNQILATFGVSAGVASLSGANALVLSSAFPTVAGQTYRVSATFLSVTGATVFLNAARGDTDAALPGPSSFTIAQTISFVFTAATSTSKIRIQITGASPSASFDNISVRELPGNHATQSILASRPTYGIVPRTGRRNLLTRTEEFGDAAWLKTNTTISADSSATTDPLGGSSADALFETTTNGFHSILPASTVIAAVSGQSYTFSFYLKANGRTKGFMSVVNGADFTTFDLTAKTNVFGGNGTNVTVTAQTITELPNGWFRLTSTVAISGSVNIRPVVGINNDSNVSSYAGDTTKGFYIWGAQLETGSSATAYQRVGSAFDVTEAGVPSLHYLSFDGIDDFLVTPTITPGVDKVQVFAGVRKLSDAATGVLVEHSTTVASNAGTFVIAAPNNTGASGNYSIYSRGSASPPAAANSAITLAPVSNVLSAFGDISGDIQRIRVNSAGEVTNTGDQGTGNYLAYPLYIGRRGGTSLSFNGQIYSFLVRFGANLDANTITNTEAWVNSKTGAY